jgi:hypothetical protein
MRPDVDEAVLAHIFYVHQVFNLSLAGSLRVRVAQARFIACYVNALGVDGGIIIDVQQGCEHMLQNSRRIGRELGVDGN